MTEQQIRMHLILRMKIIHAVAYTVSGLICLGTMIIITRLMVKRADEHAKVLANHSEVQMAVKNDIPKKIVAGSVSAKGDN